jgi:hypothetical protein
MEKLQPVDAHIEGTYDRESVRELAAVEAKELIEKEITSEVPEERFQEMVNLMQELSEDNNNRFIVEAIAQVLTIERKREELDSLEQALPLAA